MLHNSEITSLPIFSPGAVAFGVVSRLLAYGTEEFHPDRPTSSDTSPPSSEQIVWSGGLGRFVQNVKDMSRRGSNLDIEDPEAAGPNDLDYLSGHHKLAKYELVIHMCLDVFSRTMVYIQCGTNNHSSTI